MKKLKYPLYILLLLAAGACISEFNANLPSSDIDLLVVEGNIVSDSVMNFYFSKSFSLNDDTPPSEYDNVQVKLRIIGSDGSQSAYATYSGNGIHTLPVGTLNPEVAYGIEFEYDGDTYQSELARPLRTPAIDSVSWIQPVEEGDVSIRVSTHNQGSEASYFIWHYMEDWEITAQYVAYAFFNTDAFTEEGGYDIYTDFSRPVYYCWRKNNSHDILIGSTEKLTENRIINHTLYKKTPNDDRFTYLYSTLVTQQAISKGAYEYYLDKNKGNEGMGGLFTPQPSKIEGNISCTTDPDKQVIGYIDVAQNATTYRIFIDAARISSSYREMCIAIDKDSIKALLNDNTMEVLYNIGLRPLDYVKVPAPMGVMYELESMVTRRCLDCTYRGGKNKPEFWPNDHK